jgi:hypothetical protein
VLSMLGVGSGLMQLKLLSHAPYSMAEATANDRREQLITYVHLLVYMITLVVFGRWIYLAHRNLLALGARHLRVRPGWAVGSFFVPIVNLWMPFQAMRDLVKASRSPHHWQLEDTPVLLGVWWALWLVVGQIDNAIMRMQWHASTMPELHELTYLQLASRVLSVPLGLLAYYIVKRVSRDQSNTYEGKESA